LKFEKPGPEMLRLFDNVAPNPKPEHGVERRKMFGYPCCFVNGNVFMGLHGKSMVLRLSEKDRQGLLENGGSVFEPMPEHIMGEYVVVPKESKPSDLRAWIDR
jgi:hypothetical protein